MLVGGDPLLAEGAGGDHVAQDGTLMHDVGVERGVGRRRHRSHQTVQIIGAAHLLQVTLGEQLIGHQHGVDRLGGRK